VRTHSARRRRRIGLAAILLVLVVAVPLGPAASAAGSAYDEAVLAGGPVAFLDGATDLTGGGHDGAFTGEPAATTLPNGENAVQYNGTSQYLTIPDAPELSATHTGAITIEAWIRPDTLQFRRSEGSGYVHWLGKGAPKQHEYVARMYSLTNTEKRPNRVSGYAFNAVGGLGAGSYFQDSLTSGQWLHYALVINTTDTSARYPTGYTKVYRDGVLRDQDRLADYTIVPTDGTAPLRIGTRDLASFFEGAIGKVAVYDRELSASELTGHVRLMLAASGSS
jgi:hypothetical protein